MRLTRRVGGTTTDGGTQMGGMTTGEGIDTHWNSGLHYSWKRKMAWTRGQHSRDAGLRRVVSALEYNTPGTTSRKGVLMQRRPQEPYMGFLGWGGHRCWRGAGVVVLTALPFPGAGYHEPATVCHLALLGPIDVAFPPNLEGAIQMKAGYAGCFNG